MSLCSEQLTEEQEHILKSLEEEFKDRYTEKEERFKAAMEETESLPPVVENWGDFGRRDNRRHDDRYIAHSRSRSGNRNGGDYERLSYGDRYSQSSAHSYNSRPGYRKQNHYPNERKWH